MPVDATDEVSVCETHATAERKSQHATYSPTHETANTCSLVTAFSGPLLAAVAAPVDAAQPPPLLPALESPIHTALEATNQFTIDNSQFAAEQAA